MKSTRVTRATREKEITHRFSNPYRPPLDLQRVARAVLLHVEPLGGDCYRVCGRGDVYYVSLSPYFSCDCGDAIFRESICKHQIAALYFEGDAEAVALVNELREAWKAHKARQRETASAVTPAVSPVPGPEPVPSDESRAVPAERVVLGSWWS